MRINGEWKEIAIPVAGAALVFLLLAPRATAHVDSPLLTDECGSCHVGHGVPGEPMLEASEEEMCYLCHGSTEKVNKMKSKGRLSPSADPADIEREFEKPYRHPVREGTGHRPDERLPAWTNAKANHA